MSTSGRKRDQTKKVPAESEAAAPGTSNAHIAEYLDYYFKLKTPPEYAVLLNGKWGSGKTWFIRRCLEKLERDGGRSLYISLYGIGAVEGIDNEIFRQLHPILSSKSAALAGKFLRGLVKTTIKVDLDDNKHEQADIAMGVPDIKLPDYLTNTEGFVLVFDDVERCSIPINELLGYINHFVEHDDHKAVLLANEEEIVGPEDTESDKGKTYRRIKEKLIGRTFAVEPELKGAVKAFVAAVKSPDAQQSFQREEALIQELFLASTYKNLRHLRQALLDLERMIGGLGAKYRNNVELIAHLIRIFLIYSFELRNGSMRPEELAQTEHNPWDVYFDKKADRPPTLHEKLVAKYVGTVLHDTLLPTEMWRAIFESGNFNFAEIEKALDNSRHMSATTQPAWVQLWHAFDKQDAEVERLLRLVSAQFARREFDDVQVMRHVAGTLLMLAEAGIYDTPKDQIVTEAKAYIDHFKTQGDLVLPKHPLSQFLQNSGYMGLGFQASDTAEFRDVTAYMRSKADEAVIENYPKEALDLLDVMKSDMYKFLRMLSLSNDPDNQYYNIPILTYLLPEDFFSAFLNVAPYSMLIFSHGFVERYKFSDFNRVLIAEFDWLKSVAELLRQESVRRRGKMSGHLCNLAEKAIDSAMTELRPFLPAPTVVQAN